MEKKEIRESVYLPDISSRMKLRRIKGNRPSFKSAKSQEHEKTNLWGVEKKKEGTVARDKV